MSENPRIPLAGVIGHPIAHSRSPALHNYWLKRYGLKGHYIPIDIAPLDLPDLIRTLPRLGFVGLNVTIPHKEAILHIADIVTDRAALIGAANTLIFRKDGKIHADNTDGSGFVANLRQNAPHWAPATGPAVVVQWRDGMSFEGQPEGVRQFLGQSRHRVLVQRGSALKVSRAT